VASPCQTGWLRGVSLLRQLADWLGLSRADSVPNLTRRLARQLKMTPKLSKDLTEILR
jgi:hypothetical protein